jgi:hypothetical protein
VPRWRPLERPAAIALALGVPLTAAYLAVSPPAGDLAAATYRSDLFARVGFAARDTGWYAAHGHWLPGYSLLSPALGALLGVRALLALSALVACVLFAMLAERAFDRPGARAAAGSFALGVCVSLLSGRVPYGLGFAMGLAAVLALVHSLPPSRAGDRTREQARRGTVGAALALALGALAGLASPVAGALLALVAIAAAIGALLARPRTSVHAGRFAALAACALAPVLALALAYPDGGYEPFAASAFWPALAGVASIALLLPRGPLPERTWLAARVGAGLYALALIAAYAIRTPMGGNAARLGALLAAPLLAGVLWQRHRPLLFALAPALLYWQLATPIRDYAAIADDPSVTASYYAPLRAELRRLDPGAAPGGGRVIVEVPMTKAHWEAAFLAGHDGIELARGWERQLDTRYAAIFYRPALSASAYRAWLAANRVRYVALPDAPLDRAGSQEGALVARGLPYMRELWRSEHWRVYRFMG